MSLPSEAPLVAPPKFQARLNEFIRESKQILGNNLAQHSLPLTAPMKQRKFVLSHFGFQQHLPAVTATLCLSLGHAAKLHEMICSITANKCDQDMLTSKVHKWPVKEPWTKLLLATPPTLKLL